METKYITIAKNNDTYISEIEIAHNPVPDGNVYWNNFYVREVRREKRFFEKFSTPYINLEEFTCKNMTDIQIQRQLALLVTRYLNYEGKEIKE